MYDFIFILGAQGSGKTTISKLLKEKLNSPYLDLDWIRGIHLNNDWSNISDSEEKMSIENFVFLLKNYVKHKYNNIIVCGFTPDNVEQIINEKLNDYKSIVITLTLNDDEVLKNRVLNESRDSGFRDYKESIKFNKMLRDELSFSNEHKIDNTNQTPEQSIKEIESILSQ